MDECVPVRAKESVTKTVVSYGPRPMEKELTARTRAVITLYSSLRVVICEATPLIN